MSQTMKLHISTDNAAFDKDAGGVGEVARILRELADKIERGNVLPPYDVLRDTNGHMVGEATTQGARWDDEDGDQ